MMKPDFLAAPACARLALSRCALAIALAFVMVDGDVARAADAPPTGAAGAPAAPTPLPSIPIFYGDIYEGRLSPENGQSEVPWVRNSWGGSISSHPYAASFEIDLLKGDAVAYGLWTDADEKVRVNLLVPDPKNPSAWIRTGLFGVTTTHVAKHRCVAAFSAPETGKYRIEVYKDGPQEANYRFFILPRGPYQGCNRALPKEVQAKFDVPAKPASRAIAESWVGKTHRPQLQVPAVFGSPTTADAISYAANKPEALRPFHLALYADGEHNAVLNFQKLGLAAMELGHWSEAEWAFDEALSRIEAVYGRTSVAEAARSKWVSEGIKDFKGEPHERAMAYYYRGLLYLRAGEYDNARAAFIGGEFQDTLSEVEQFQGDFALLNYLSGWSSYCLGNTSAANEAFSIAESINPAIKRPVVGQNTLVIADIGRGPVKMARGQQYKLLAFIDPLDAGRDEQAVASAAGATPLALQEYSNVYFQATTRGGRAFDAILGGKAALKTGLAATTSAAKLLAQSGVLPLMAAGAVIAVATGATAAQVQSEADVRTWDTLPHRVSVDLAKASPSASFDFSFKSEASAVIPAMPVMRAHHGRCGIAWSRSRSAVDVAAGAPGNNAEIVKTRLKNKEALARDTAFRQVLAAHPTVLQ